VIKINTYMTHIKLIKAKIQRVSSLFTQKYRSLNLSISLILIQTTILSIWVSLSLESLVLIKKLLNFLESFNLSQKLYSKSQSFAPSFNRHLRQFGSFGVLILTMVSLAQFSFINVNAVSPGPFWTWDGTGIPIKMPNSENFEKVFVGGDGDYLGQNQPFYFAKQGVNILSWGANSVGQLGDGTNTDVVSPTINPNLAGVTKIASGNLKSLGLKNDGTVLFWGQQGNGYLSTPIAVTGLSSIIDIDMQFNGGLALDSLGNAYEIPWPGDSSSLVLGITNIVAISQGGDARYVLDQNGKVWAWGTNSSGQLGDGTTTDNFTPTIVKNLPQIKAISAGFNSVLALDTNGDVWAWGRSSENQIGQGEANPQTTPLRVLGLPPVKEIYAASNSSKVVDFSQKVWEWGQVRTGGQSNIPTTISNPVNPAKPMLADSGTLDTNGFVTIAKRDLIVQSSIEISNTTNQISISPSGNLQYSYQYVNNSSLTANNLVISTILDSSINFLNCSDVCVQNGQAITWNIGDVAPSGSQTLTLDVSLLSSTPIGKLSNTIESTGSNFDPASATSTIDVVKDLNSPDLTLSITSSADPVSKGDNFTYFLNYSNTLAQDANNVVITDTLDPRLTVTYLPGNCTQVDQIISCTVGTVASGSNGSVDISVQVANDAAAGILANTGIISSDQSLPRSSGNQINVNLENIDPGITITKTTTGNIYSAISGDTVPYAITLQNKSLITDYTNISLSDVLDQRLDYNNDCSDSCTIESFTPNNNTFTINTLEWSGLTIPANTSLTITYSTTVKNSAASGELWNTAILSYDQCSPICVQGNKSSSFPISILESGQNTPNGDIDYTVTKTASNLTPKPGDIIDYTITVESKGVVGLLQFTDVLDPRLTFVSCTAFPNCNQNGQTITFDSFITPNFGSIVIHIFVKVNDNATSGTLNNTILVDDGNPNKDPQAKSATATVQVQPLSNSPLQISKVSSKSVVSPADSFDYIINYANIGNSNLDGVTITDTLDPRLTFNSCTGGCSQSGQTITWVPGALNSGDVNSVSISVTVNNSAIAGLLANSGIISANQTNSVSGITYVRVVVPQASTSINLIKTASVNSVTPGGQITYNLKYTNTSNVGLTGATITDNLDPRLEFVSCSNSCTQNGQNIVWDLGSLEAGAGSTVNILANVKPDAALGTLTNSASFDTNETSPVVSSNDVDIQAITVTSINLIKTASVNSVTPGGQITYNLKYTNTSNVGLTGATITDNLDPRLEFVSCSNSCTQNGQNISWNLGDLALGNTDTVSVVVNAKSDAATGTIINTGFFDTNETTAISSSVNVNILPIVPFTLAKVASETNVDRGTTYNYTINYTNPNIINANNVLISDTLDPRLDFISCSNSCTQNGQNISWNIGSVAASGTGSVTITVKVKNLAASGTLTNTAQITSTETGAITAAAFVSINRIYQTATPTLSKSQNKTELLRGDSITYTINYSNNSDVDFSNAEITDVLNSNLSFVSCSNSCAQTGQNLSWNIGLLPIGASGSFTVNVNVKSNATLGLLQNIATISTTEAPTIQAFSYGSIIVNDPILTSELSISKSASISAANRGDTFSYTLSYKNGLTAVTNTIISDNLDSRLTFISCTNSCTQAGQLITWNLGNLTTNDSGSVTIIVSVKDNAQIGGLDNIATIDSTETTIVNSNKVTVAITIPDNPTLNITKTVNNSTVAPGGNLTYTINYLNTANQSTTNTIITDVLNSNLSFVSCSNSCSQSGQAITWNIGSLAPNASGSVTLSVLVVNATPNGLINNTASIVSNETSSSSSSASVAVVANTPADVSILKTSSASTLKRGDTFTYTINYINGSVPVTNTVITDTLDSRLTFQGCAGCTRVGQNLTWNIGNLAGNATGSVTVTVQVNNNATLGSLTNAATIDTAETSPKTAETNIAIIIDDPTPVLSILASNNPNNLNPGQTTTYTINYTNQSTVPITNASLTTTLNSNLSVQSGCTGICSQVGQVLTWNIGNLAVGGSGSVSFTANFSSSTPAGLISTKFDISSSETATNSSNAALAIIPVSSPSSPNFSITKTASANTLNPGDNVSYQISYSNPSTTNATSVTITDILNSNLSFVSCSNSCSQSGQTITWSLLSLPINASGNFTIVAKIKPNANTNLIQNTAIMTASGFNPASSTASIAVVTPNTGGVKIVQNQTVTGTNLNVLKTADKQVAQSGEKIVFTIQYSNDGPSQVKNIVVEDSLSKYLEFINCSQNCQVSGQNLSWSILSLDSGQKGNITVEAKVKALPSVLGANSTQDNQDSSPKFTVDQSLSRATIKGDGTIQESSTSAVAVFNLTAGSKVISKLVEQPNPGQFLVRTGAVQNSGSYVTYLVIELMLFGFVYMSLVDRKLDN